MDRTHRLPAGDLGPDRDLLQQLRIHVRTWLERSERELETAMARCHLLEARLEVAESRAACAEARAERAEDWLGRVEAALVTALPRGASIRAELRRA